MIAVVLGILCALTIMVALSATSAGAGSGASVAGAVFSGSSGQRVDTARLGAGPAARATLSAAFDEESAQTTGRLVVKFAPSVSAASRADILGALRLRELRFIPRLDVSVVVSDDTSVSSGAGTVDLSAAAGALDERPEVMWVQADALCDSNLVPDDPIYSYQWGPPAVALPPAWDLTTGSATVTVAVVDTGLEVFDDFAGRIVSPYSIIFDSPSQALWTDIVGHGTGVTGVLAAMGGDDGMVGAAWNVNIMPVHISDELGYYVSDGVTGVVYAVDHGADVINISSGSTTSESGQMWQEAIDYASAHDVVVVAAAGNSGAGAGIAYPAALPGVIAVGAVSESGSRADFSSTGEELDITGPGEDIATYFLDESTWGFAYTAGTSFSTPLLSGIVALMLSRNPSLTVSQVADILAYTADDMGVDGWDQEYGDGQVNAQRAVRSAGDETAPAAGYSEPLNGSTLRGTVQVVLDVSDQEGVVRVEQYLDGDISFTTMLKVPHYYDENTSGPLYIQDLNTPIEGSLDTAKMADGSSHTLSALVYDAAGNMSEATMTFAVDNRDPVTSSTTTTTAPQAPEFSDVPAEHPYSVQILDLAQREIVLGFEDGLFRPDSSVIRQQFAKMIVKTLTLPVTGDEACPFGDVATQVGEDPFYPSKYVAVCSAAQITKGKTEDPPTFAPYEDISRQQLFTMVARAAGLAEPPASYDPPFLPQQFAIQEHYLNARKAAYAGLLDGLVMGEAYSFVDPATRGEVCVLLYNLLP